MQGERKTKRKRSFQRFVYPSRSLIYLKLVQGERKRSFQRFDFPSRSLIYLKLVQGERKKSRRNRYGGTFMTLSSLSNQEFYVL